MFENIDFAENADWLLVKTNTDKDKSKIVRDKNLLLRVNNELIIKSNEECGGTTPDNCLGLYKNGKRIRSVCYCSWIPLSYELGQLEKEFIPTKLNLVKTNSIARHDFLLDSLKQFNNIYLLYPKDTIIRFPNQLKFDIKLVDKDQDIFEQEKPIEKEFRRIFDYSNYQVKAEFYSSEVGTPNKLGYHLIVDCDSSFFKNFNISKLNQNELFQEMTNYKYSMKEFIIRYYEWNE